MSRQPSPGLAASTQQTSYYRDAHGNPIEKSGPQLKIVYRAGENQGAQPQQDASTPVPVATSLSSGRTRSKAYQSGPAAGAEDVKYAAKYRDLKHKVKEIEADNDRLMFKVLQAKRNIQRAKLERAVLYERLAQLPASPPQGNVPLPPQHVVQQQVPAGGSVPRHQDAQPYGQSGRHQRTSGQTAPHHHHHRHQQQPIQPAPPSHVSPPQHHVQAHHVHHPTRDASHPGQLPITHAQQVVTISTPDGPLRVVAGPDGRPVTTEDGRVIPAQDIHQPPPPSAPAPRKRGGRVSKEVRELREREAREMREREEMERKQAMLATAGPNSGHLLPGIEPQRSSSGHMQAVSPPLSAQVSGHVVPISSRERDWEIERESRERERMQRREGREEERERHGHHGHHHHTHAHSHGHRNHQERISSPPPPAEQTSSPQVHRSHSQASHASYRSYHSHHSHHIHSHSHSHSASPLSPGGSSYPATRIHNHQRVGPGSYVLRDRDRADVPPTESAAAATPIPATPMQSDDTSTSAPTPIAPPSRVPTPPYPSRPGRADIYNNNSSPPGEEAAATAKIEARPGDEGSGTNTGSTTPT